jgi:hypothetical protein
LAAQAEGIAEEPPALKKPTAPPWVVENPMVAINSQLQAPCPNCGYSLEGLAADCVCPECGIARNPDELVLWGWATGAHANFGNARPRRVAWLIFSAFCSIWWIFLFGRSPWLYLISLSVLLRPAFELFRRWHSMHPGLIQVRFDNYGCVQIDDLNGPSPVEGWSRILFGVFLVALWICLFTDKPRGISLGAGLAGLSLLSAACGWWEWKWWHQPRLDLPESATAERSRQMTPPAKWQDVRFVLWKPIKKNLMSINVKMLNSDKIPVDAEVICDADTRLRIDSAIHEWIRLARQAGSDLAQQQQDHQDDQHEPEPTAGAIAPTAAVTPGGQGSN